jgi:hypothetical protein
MSTFTRSGSLQSAPIRSHSVRLDGTDRVFHDQLHANHGGEMDDQAGFEVRRSILGGDRFTRTIGSWMPSAGADFQAPVDDYPPQQRCVPG